MTSQQLCLVLFAALAQILGVSRQALALARVGPVSEVCLSESQRCRPGWFYLPYTDLSGTMVGSCYHIAEGSFKMCEALSRCKSQWNARLLYFDSFAEWVAFETSGKVRWIVNTTFKGGPRLWFGLVTSQLCQRSKWSCPVITYSWAVRAGGSGHGLCRPFLNFSTRVMWEPHEFAAPWWKPPAPRQPEPAGDGHCHEITVADKGGAYNNQTLFWNDIACESDRLNGYICKAAANLTGRCDCMELNDFEKRLCNVTVEGSVSKQGSILTLNTLLRLDNTAQEQVNLAVDTLNASIQQDLMGVGNRTEAAAIEIALVANVLIERLFRDIMNIPTMGRVFSLLQQYSNHNRWLGVAVRPNSGRVLLDGQQGNVTMVIHTALCAASKRNTTCRYGYRLDIVGHLKPSLAGPYFLNSQLQAPYNSISGDGFPLARHGVDHLCGQLVDPTKDEWDTQNCSPSTEEILPLGSNILCNCSNGSLYFHAVFSRALNDTPIMEQLRAVNHTLMSAATISAEVIEDVTRDMEKAVEQRSTTKEIGELLLLNINTILQNTAVDVLQLANRRQQTSSRLLKVVTNYFSQVLLDGENGERRSIHRVGHAFGAVVLAADREAGLRQNRYSAVTNNEEIRSSAGDNGHFGSSITLPPDSVGRDDDDTPYVPVQYSVFANTKVFQLSSEQTDGIQGTLATAVLAAQVGKESIHFGEDEDNESNDSYVAIEFDSQMAGSDPMCVFWDLSLNGGLGGWNSSGCWRLNASNYKIVNVSQTVICYCNHLTHFGMLLAETSSSKGLLAITIATAVFTSICVLILICTMVAFRKLRRELRSKLLLQLCIALFLSSIFLAVTDQVDAKKDTSACTALAVLLHYFPLALILWTNVEAFYLHRLLVMVYNKTISRFFLKVCIFAWGVPVAIVFITMAADKFSMKNYGDNASCVLASSYAIYAFYLPLGLAMLANFVVFCILCHEITKKRSGSGKQMTKMREHVRQLFFCLSVAFLLGLSWVIGFIILAEPNSALQYIFAVLQLLMAVCLLVFHIFMRREIRDAWQKTVGRRLSSWYSESMSRRATASTVVKETTTSTFKGTESDISKKSIASESEHLTMTISSANLPTHLTIQSDRSSLRPSTCTSMTSLIAIKDSSNSTEEKASSPSTKKPKRHFDGVQVLPTDDKEFNPDITVSSTVDHD